MIQQASNRPNVIMIICDDLCYGDLACHGNPYTHTPNLNRVYAEGVRLTRHCSPPMCAPARSSLMTGRYAYRTGAYDTAEARALLHPDEVTIARLLQGVGCRTGAFGKWHLGDVYPTRAMDHGFEETLVHLGGGLGIWADHPNNPRKENHYDDPLLVHNGRLEQYKGYGPDIFTDGAIEFMEGCVGSGGDRLPGRKSGPAQQIKCIGEDNVNPDYDYEDENENEDEDEDGLEIQRKANKRNPFFIYLATNTPHTPLSIDERWVKRYRDQGVNDTHARLYGMVENIDYNVGRILDKLDDLGIAKNTIVIFTSDHGPCNTARNFEAPPGQQVRYNAGLRDIKGTIYEGGIRVPCLWRWPGAVPEGVDVDRVTSTIDVLPTLATLCGAEVPKDRKIDGIDLLPLLTGKARGEEWPDRMLFMQWHRGDEPVRYRNYGVVTQRYKLTRPTESWPDELYDLIEDPGETRNIADQYPVIVDKLRAHYDAWLDDVSSTRPNNYLPPDIFVGSDHQNPVILHRQDARPMVSDPWGKNIGTVGWQTVVAKAGEYKIQVVFGAHFPWDIMEPGTVHVRVGDVHVMQPTDDAEKIYVFAGVHLNEGPAQINAWMDSRNNFVAAIWLEVERK